MKKIKLFLAFIMLFFVVQPAAYSVTKSSIQNINGGNGLSYSFVASIPRSTIQVGQGVGVSAYVNATGCNNVAINLKTIRTVLNGKVLHQHNYGQHMKAEPGATPLRSVYGTRNYVGYYYNGAMFSRPGKRTLKVQALVSTSYAPTSISTFNNTRWVTLSFPITVQKASL